MKGLYHSYKSDYPNQVHQLNFFISQNYYLLKNGEIKFQVKKFDVNWSNYQLSGKHHLVVFLVRDHFSNCFYAEIYPINEVPHIMVFLFNAWKQKKQFEFCGIPKNLIVGRHIFEKFPEIVNFQKNTGINIELAKNGFATGIRSVRDWETRLRYYTHYVDCKNIYDFQKNTEFICRDLNLKNSRKTEPNLSKWTNNDPQGKIINNFEIFEKLFTKLND